MTEPLTEQERAELRRQAEEAEPSTDEGYLTMEVSREVVLALLDELDALRESRNGTG